MDLALTTNDITTTSPRMSVATPIHDKVNGKKRKRKGAQSPDSGEASDDGGEDGDERSKAPAKRACNECRQQKVRKSSRGTIHMY